MSQTDGSRQILAARSAADGAFVPALPRRSAFWLLFALFLVTANSTDCGTPPIPASASYIRSLSGSFLLLHVSSMAFFDLFILFFSLFLQLSYCAWGPRAGLRLYRAIRLREHETYSDRSLPSTFNCVVCMLSYVSMFSTQGTCPLATSPPSLAS